MKWASDIDPTLDSYKNTEGEKHLAANMIHRVAINDTDRADLIGMLFAPMSRRMQP